MSKEIIKWLAKGETGVSSKTMAFAALGEEMDWPSHPHDPDDLNRCIKLVDAAPIVKDYFPTIAKISKQWDAVIRNWDTLREMFIAEAGYDWCNAKSAPKTYYMMKGIGL